MSDWLLLSQGAEARVYSLNYLGRSSIIKQRFIKNYRIPELDTKINNRRILQEARSLNKCLKSDIRVPIVYQVSLEDRSIIMEKIDGFTLKQVILDKKLTNIEIEKIMTSTGNMISKLHQQNIIHGDLTTSNLLIDLNQKVIMIDFGLSSISSTIEDKAVDLFVLEKAFLATHPKDQDLFELILENYSNETNNHQVVKKLDEVRLRGRKRSMVG